MSLFSLADNYANELRDANAQLVDLLSRIHVELQVNNQLLQQVRDDVRTDRTP